MFFLNKFIKPPLLHLGNEHTETELSSGSELFIDLIFVGAMSLVAENLEHNYSLFGLTRSVLLFIPIWWSWIGQTLYLARFDSDDFLHRGMGLLQTMAIACLVIHASAGTGQSSIGFALSCAMVRFILTVEYLFAGTRLPITRQLTNLYISGYMCSIFLWIISTTLPIPLRWIIWACAICIDLAIPLSETPLLTQFPPRLVHLHERFAIFTLIVLGESFINMIIGIDHSGLHFQPIATGVLGIITAFTIWWIYFDGREKEDTSSIKSFKRAAKHTIWIFSHFPLVIGIFGTFIGVKYIIGLDPDEKILHHQSILLCTTLSITMIALHCIRIASHKPIYSKPFLGFIFPHFMIILAIFMLGFVGHILHGVELMILLTLSCLIQVLVLLR